MGLDIFELCVYLHIIVTLFLIYEVCPYLDCQTSLCQIKIFLSYSVGLFNKKQIKINEKSIKNKTKILKSTHEERPMKAQSK